MKLIVRLEQNSSATDIEVIIKYPEPSAEVDKLSALLKSAGVRIKCRTEGGEALVSAADVYYFESVDKRTFVYLEHSVYRTDAPLYRLHEQLQPLGFVQISKACIMNIAMLESVKPLGGSRMEAMLRNGERLYITRKYLEDVKLALRKEALQ